MIRGYFDDEGRPVLRAHVRVLGPGAEGGVEFLVSTGSPATILSPRDADYLRIRYGDQGGDGEAAFTDQMGQTMAVKKIPVAITLNAGEREHRLETDLIVPRPEAMDRAQPSVLGRDILRHMDMVMDQMGGRLEFGFPEADRK